MVKRDEIQSNDLRGDPLISFFLPINIDKLLPHTLYRGDAA
jgi:hypothetical protein